MTSASAFCSHPLPVPTAVSVHSGERPSSLSLQVDTSQGTTDSNVKERAAVGRNGTNLVEMTGDGAVRTHQPFPPRAL